MKLKTTGPEKKLGQPSVVRKFPVIQGVITIVEIVILEHVVFQ